MIEPIGDFYCKPQSEEEAREILDRAVAHGAKPNMSGLVFSPEIELYAGVGSGKARVFSENAPHVDIPGFEHLTLDQLRERAPLVGELTGIEVASASVDKYRFCDMMPHFDESRWQAARRALHFAGTLTNDEEDKVEAHKDAGWQVDRVNPEYQEEAPKGNESPTPHKPAHDFLNAALGHMQDRAATYDAPSGERSIGKTVAAFNALYGTGLTEEQGWAFMCLLKLVRTSQGAFRADNYEDLAAYAGLMGGSASKGE